MEQNSIFHDRYRLDHLLGRGNFSEVWLAHDTKTDIDVALKIYAPATGLDDHGLNVFAREFALVVNANHKNLLKPLYYDSCERKPYLVLPYCQQGSIAADIGRFSEQDAWRLLRDVAGGLAWLHAMNPPVIHQDIKPDNIMVGSNGDFMITDFGVSTHLRSTLRKSMSSAFSSAGTMGYMAPERFGKDNTPIMANDIYSLGATVYEMLTGQLPFGEDGGLMQKKGADIPSLPNTFSPQLNKVLNKCMQLQPWSRPTAEQLEAYATAGMAGQPVRYVDEKTFFQRWRWVILAACVVVVAGVVGVIVGLQKAAKVRALNEACVAHWEQTLDSLEQLTAWQIGQADSLAALGSQDVEGADDILLEAYETYGAALATIAEIPGVITLPDGTEHALSPAEQPVARINDARKTLEGQLYDWYQIVEQKIADLADFPELVAVQEMRLQKIRNAINVDSLNAAAIHHRDDSELTLTPPRAESGPMLVESL